MGEAFFCPAALRVSEAEGVKNPLVFFSDSIYISIAGFG